jgi:ankyrin repeat protein
VLSDEQVLQMECPGEEAPFISKTGNSAEEMAKEEAAKGTDGGLAVACMTGNVDLLRGCLAIGMDPNQRVLNTNCTPLMCAIEAPCHGQIEGVIGCVATLLNGRADPNAVDDKSHTALHRAYVMQLPSVVDLLLAGGAIPKRCEWGKCSKCILQTKLALRRKPHPASEPVRAVREAAEKAKKAEREANTFEKVLEEEFGGGVDLLDFAKLLEEEKGAAGRK